MAPYDVPHVAHDMILRFMGTNFSAIVDGSANIPSSIGDNDTKPIFQKETDPSATNTPGSGKTPQQNKAMWEGTYFVPLCTCMPVSDLTFCKLIITLDLRHLSLSLYSSRLVLFCGVGYDATVSAYQQEIEAMGMKRYHSGVLWRPMRRMATPGKMRTPLENEKARSEL
jgi:hypothetical protein